MSILNETLIYSSLATHVARSTVYEAVKNMTEEQIVEYVKSHPLPNQAIKIRKTNPTKNHEIDRSNILNRSLVILPNPIVFATGKGENGKSRPGGIEAKLLGEGSQKTVFAVLDLVTNTWVAIAQSSDKNSVETMKLEDKLSNRPDSPFILRAECHVRMTRSLDEVAYLVTQICHASLDAKLIKNPDYLLEHPEIVAQIESAIKACHSANVAHCDVIFANIFLIETESGAVIAKLADFGRAKETLAEPLEKKRVERIDYLFLKKLQILSTLSYRRQ